MGVLALACVAGLVLAVLSPVAGAEDTVPVTVTVTQDGFSLTCDAEVAEGETLACTLANSSSEAQPWPVVALLHLSADEDRALVVGSPVDVGFGSLSPVVELDSSVWWIGETLVGYSRFDWDGDADGVPADPPPTVTTLVPPETSRTVSIAVVDDAAAEGSEQFYVALGPDGSDGVGFLYNNKQSVTVTEDDAKSSDVALSSLSASAGGGVGRCRRATPPSRSMWPMR
ncbi:hypothetical protein [Candidatus Poriferisodalis sp.]|uniref:hypothetical protein n=1 Tax=Candidatus Poriferisodalis sp. TaxID=3101277 RepID=UPI003B01B4CB